MNPKTLLLTLLTILSLTSCTIEELSTSEITITIDGKPLKSELTFSYLSGDKITLEFDCLVFWKVVEKPDWLDIDPSKGANTQTVTVTMTVNRDNIGAVPLDDKIVFLLINGEKFTLKVRQEGDGYAIFKSDATPRWERGATVEKNETTTHTFVTDASGKLFSSPKYKTGRITIANGNQYEIIEFTGPPAVGKPTGASIRKPATGSVPLHSLEIIKMEGRKLWMVFKETSNSPERRVVQ